MPKKFFRKYIPSHETILSHRWARRFKPWLGHHNLWHLNRHSVAGGVAVGAFAGLIPGPLQMLGATLLAVALRVNLPVAMFTTLYTNPFTIVPLYAVAYAIGQFVTGGTGGLPRFDFDWQGGSWLAAIPAFLQWAAALGTPLFVGLFLLAGLLATASYFTVQGLWRLHVIRAWRKRQRRRG
ncbi:MAG: DUF2062 domain-containing protein [Burkholderiales bacterium]